MTFVLSNIVYPVQVLHCRVTPDERVVLELDWQRDPKVVGNVVFADERVGVAAVTAAQVVDVRAGAILQSVINAGQGPIFYLPL